MKQKINACSRKLKTIYLLFTFCIAASGSYAQYNIVATSGTNVETSWAFPNAQPTWMNNAVFTNSDGSLYGEAWDEGGGSVYIELHDNGAPVSTTGVVTLGSGLTGNQSHPDIVLGGDNGNNYVGIVYTNDNSGSTDVYLEVYTVNGVGSGTGTLTLGACSTFRFNISNSQRAGNAHIDLANETYPTNLEKADRFVIVWEDYLLNTCYIGVNPGGLAKSASLSSLANCNTTTFASTGCLNIPGINANQGAARDIDMAIRYDASTAKYSADFTYWWQAGNGQYWVYVGRWNDITGTSTVTQGVRLIHGNMNQVDFPRIDVYDSQPISTTTANADIVYRWYDPGSGYDNVMNVNNLVTTGDEITKYYYDGTWIYPNSKPVVTAGTEGDVSGDYYRLYSVAYANPELDEVFVNNIKHSDGRIYPTHTSSPPPDYRIVNDNDLIRDPVAISNDYIVMNNADHTFKPDQVYVCWYNQNNASIDCKHTASVAPVFKPAGIAAVKKAHVKMYPNPAGDEVVLERQGAEASSYSLTDVLGRELMKGGIGQAVTHIDIAGLAPGLYLLNVSYKNESRVEGLKVVKE